MPSRQFNMFLQKRIEKIEFVALLVCDQTIRTARCQGSREVKTRSTGKSTIRQRSTKTWYGPRNSNPTKNSWLKSTTKKSNLTCCTGWLNLEFVSTQVPSRCFDQDPIMRLGSKRSLLGLTCRYSPFNPWNCYFGTMSSIRAPSPSSWIQKKLREKFWNQARSVVWAFRASIV